MDGADLWAQREEAPDGASIRLRSAAPEGVLPKYMVMVPASQYERLMQLVAAPFEDMRRFYNHRRANKQHLGSLPTLRKAKPRYIVESSGRTASGTCSESVESRQAPGMMPTLTHDDLDTNVTHKQPRTRRESLKEGYSHRKANTLPKYLALDAHGRVIEALAGKDLKDQQKHSTTCTHVNDQAGYSSDDSTRCSNTSSACGVVTAGRSSCKAISNIAPEGADPSQEKPMYLVPVVTGTCQVTFRAL